MKLGRPGMRTVPAKPAEAHAAICLRPSPACAMHHRKPFAKDVNASEPTVFQDSAAAVGFEECQPQKHDHARAELERVLHEFVGELERWIREDHFASRRH